MITAAQMRAARALLGVDQRILARLAGVSLPTIQRMETSTGNVRGNVDSLTKVVAALDGAGLELIGENTASPSGGRGVRLKSGGGA
jgi:predicted transcriptional regulator